MSRPPGIIDRVNAVVEMWNNPCETPWAVYVETAGPAALEALIQVVCFDIGDVLRFIFRPANVRSGRHGSRGRKGQHGRKPKGIRAKLADKLPPFKKLQQRKMAQGVRNLWIIDGIGQRLLWWWLVIDVATGFAYNWTSMIYKSERCQMALSPGYAVRVGNNQIFLAITGWQDVGYPDLQYEKGAVSTAAFAFSCGDGEYSVVASLAVKNTGPLDNTVEIRIHTEGPGGPEDSEGGAAGVKRGNTADVVMSTSRKGPFNGWVELNTSQGSVTGTNGAIYIQGQPPKMKPPVDFTCNSPFFPG